MIHSKLGQFREREAVPVSWWRQLAELALLLVLAGILARCAKLPPVLTPPCEPLAAQLAAPEAAVAAPEPSPAAAKVPA